MTDENVKMPISKFMKNHVYDNTTIETEEKNDDEIKFSFDSAEYIIESNKQNSDYVPRVWSFLQRIEKQINEEIYEIDGCDDCDYLFSFGEEFDFNADKFMKIEGNSFNDSQIKTFNVVGSISGIMKKNNPFTLRIQPRFGGYKFLRYLIDTVYGFLEIEDRGDIKDSHSDLNEWILLYTWKQALKKAYQIGLPKTYETFQEDTSRIRGSININKLSQRTHSTGKFPCKYRKYSYDNSVTRLIGFTFDHIMKEYKQEFKTHLQDIYREGNLFRQISEFQNFDVKKLDQIKLSNPYYHRYNKVIDLSRKLLKNSGFAPGKFDDLSAYLFDISMIFEHHIRKMLKHYTNLAIENKNRSSYKFAVGAAKDHDFNARDFWERKLKPDIVIKQGSSDLMIFDVKYKKLYDDEARRLKREDFYQLISYLSLYDRYDKSANVRGGGIIFPDIKKIDKNNDEMNFMINQAETKLWEKQINLYACGYPVLENGVEKEGEDYFECLKDLHKKFAEKFDDTINNTPD